MWNERAETLPREQLRILQGVRLRETVDRIYHTVPFYRKKMEALGVKPEHIKTAEDIRLLPFTYKQDLRDNYPFGLFTVPMEQIVRIHASSGTTGKLTVVGYTAGDIDIWSEVMARSFASIGVTKGSIVHVAYGYGLFTGGLGAHYGAEKLGATVIPVSGGNTPRQVMLLKDFGATIIACTPSYALHIADTMKEQGIKKEDLHLKAGLFGAEPWTEAMRKEIEERLGLEAFDVYGLSEIIGPGVAVDCTAHNGLHVFEDHFLPEIIHPETEQPLRDGEPGELIFSTITKEGMPLLRYRTRDLSTLEAEPCACGRTHRRMRKVLGRSDDMLIIRGVNVFPTQIETILVGLGEVEPHYLLVVNRENNLDTLEVWVEMTERLFSDEVRLIEETERKIRALIATNLGITAKVKLVEPHTIPRSEGKAKRIQDNRNLK